MLISLLSFLFDVILFVLNIATWVVLIYVILALVAPQNKYTVQIGKYVEPILAPIRKFLFKTFPKLAQLGIDFSPLGFYILIQVAVWLVQLLYNILL